MISCDNQVDSPAVLAMRKVLGNFASHRQQVVDGDGHAWSWAVGVILFPEALCPHCNGVMRSTRIWHVDERGQRIIAVASLDDGKVQRVTSRVHPHVDETAGGHVCTGNARSTTEALFLGLGMGSPYWNPPLRWYKEVFDHECSTSSRRNSRNHLTASMALGEEKVEAPVAEANATAVRVEAECREAIMASNRQRTAALRERIAGQPPWRLSSRRREPLTERPLFDGSMAGNSNNRGISAADSDALPETADRIFRS